jgi:hypothetical protein
MSFQKQTNQQPAPGIAGDFATTNPRATVVAGPGALVAGVGGLTCGLFGWCDPATFSVVTNAGAGAPNGFVHNAHNALITQYLAETSLIIPQGFEVGDLFDAGDFWVVNNGTTPATPGQKAYANNSNGQASFAATGTPPTGASATGVVTAGTATVTGSIAIVPGAAGVAGQTAPGILTVTAGSGLVIGATLSGGAIISGTTIVAQLTGTAGGTGTYQVSVPQTVSSLSITATWGILTISGSVTGAFAVGQTISGTSVVAGTFITALGTGTGGDGTYILSNNTAVSSTTITAYSATETGWYCRSFGAPGEVVKISSRAMG